MNAADASAKLTPHFKKRRDTIKLIKQKLNDYNLLNKIQWDINLINFNVTNWILLKLLSKINKEIFTELFKDGKLCFYN